ncbi:MAG TPA: hypothetical protein VF808_18700 [Ktedonobacterales bacterium]
MRASRIILLATLLAVALLAACGQSALPARQRPSGSAAGGAQVSDSPPDATPRPLPRFSDWRVAYIGPDGRLRAVTLDGKSTAVGLALPIRGFTGSGVFAAGVSPDGARLAYLSDGLLTIVDTRAGTLRRAYIHSGDSPLSWSPDGRWLALNEAGRVMRVSGADLSQTLMPPPAPSAASALAVSGPDGWLDATHVGVTYLPGSSDSRTSYQSLDLASGALRPIATVAANQGATFSAQPGGASTLFWTARYRGDPYVAQAALIDNVTGAQTPLPAITAALSNYGFLALLWRPNSTQALAVTMYRTQSGLLYFLLDSAHDTATQITLPAYPEAWTPDGTALLLAASAQQPIAEDAPGFTDTGALGSGPYTLSIAPLAATGAPGPSTMLTTRAMTIPTLGFVRTA